MKAWFGNDPKELQAGVDEAGRGSLVGPLCVAAVVWDPERDASGIVDSKKISPKKRAQLRKTIEEQALAWSVITVPRETIDARNVFWATMDGMVDAVDSLSLPPERILVDGNRFKGHATIPHECVVKGDSLYVSIAAASILAKEHRDEAIRDLVKRHPSLETYEVGKNMGYATARHREAIRMHGYTPFHRTTFHLKRAPVSIPGPPCDGPPP